MNAADRERLGAGVAASLAAMGAPELPAHHMYRVVPEAHSDHVVRVEVRRLNVAVGSTRLSWSTFSTRDGEPAVDRLVRAAAEAHADAFPEGVPA